MRPRRRPRTTEAELQEAHRSQQSPIAGVPVDHSNW